MWRSAFVAMSVTVGEPLEHALEALGDGAQHVAGLAERLRTGSREARARALAEALAPIAADIAARELTWRG